MSFRSGREAPPYRRSNGPHDVGNALFALQLAVFVVTLRPLRAQAAEPAAIAATIAATCLSEAFGEALNCFAKSRANASG